LNNPGLNNEDDLEDDWESESDVDDNNLQELNSMIDNNSNVQEQAQQKASHSQIQSAEVNNS
jgi:hypothetical protein